MEKDSIIGWMPVSTALPASGKLVIVTDGKEVLTGLCDEFERQDDGAIKAFWRMVKKIEITHWMPIPSIKTLPKE